MGANTFTGELIKQGNRYFIPIPFSVWDKCGQKGVVPVKVLLKACSFECKLVPKGAGMYCIPVAKSIVDQLEDRAVVHVCLEALDGLTRINQNSPYTQENPIRKIDSIQRVTYPKAGYCGQICLAMLTKLSVEEIVERTQAKAWQCSFSKVIEALDYYGLAHDEKITYTRGKEVVLPECCIVNVKEGNRNHLVLFYHGNYYDEMEITAEKIIGYLKISID